MQLNKKNIDHIEVYDETGRLVVVISDQEITKVRNYKVNICEKDIMFKDDDVYS